ncbi:AAA family ATPase [Eleftheria terrae]|uniref:AAA family ATPase n=1 Tax=Eleftheria terrae TaxID=1597781 RepID=UPI00263B8194|nr:AAA family ATPase [Eleftheria terrae]WKB53999.1 ATP-binding protein [Eleftheria terrae]
MAGQVIALLGAESTGKTELARALALRLRAGGVDAVAVPEYLRLFCEARGRTPREDEQRHIAEEQSRLIDTAAARHTLVVADTTALMIAVYSDFVFGDRSLYPDAEQVHARQAALTLLMGLDLPWVADGLQRDGPQVRDGVDQRVRAALQRAGLAYGVVYGVGEARLEAAWQAVRPLLPAGPGPGGQAGPPAVHGSGPGPGGVGPAAGATPGAAPGGAGSDTRPQGAGASDPAYCTECLDGRYERLFTGLLGRDAPR